MLSVIVPIYNVEGYLPKCIESIIGQTYQPLEILLVDDGSTDRCPQICDRFAEMDKRIKVIHKENEGLVRARKTGLYMAKNDYITFVDGDDWIDKEMYRVLMEIAKDSKADFVHSGFICEGEEKVMIENIKKEEYKFDEYIRHKFFLSISGLDNFIEISPSIWSKIFKADLIKECYAKVPDNMAHGEDIINLLYCILKAEKMVRVKNGFYHYNYREGSISHTKSVSYIKKEATLWSHCRNIMLENDTFITQEDMDTVLVRKLYAALEFVAGSEFDVVQYYAFPHTKELFDKKIVLYGAGKVGKDYLTQISKYERCKIVCWTDRRYEKHRYEYREVVSIEEFLKRVYDIVLIAVEKEEIAEEIKLFLLEKNVPEKKIVWYKPKIIGSKWRGSW